MFGFHKADPRRTPDRAIDAMDQYAGLFWDEKPSPFRSIGWELRLLDFAHLCFQVRENLAGQRITHEQAERALRTLDHVLPCLLEQFPELGPRDRLEAGCEALRKLVRWAVDGPVRAGGYADERTLAFLDAHMLENAAHSEALDCKRARLLAHPLPGTAPLIASRVASLPASRAVKDVPLH